jgi:MFS family permease
MGRKQILVSSMLATAVVLAAMAFTGGSPLFIALVAVLGFFLYATRPVIQAWMLDSTPKNMAGSSIGVLFGAQALGGALGPLLGGMVADRGRQSVRSRRTGQTPARLVIYSAVRRSQLGLFVGSWRRGIPHRSTVQ